MTDTTPELTWIVELYSPIFGDTMLMPVLAPDEDTAVESALAVTFGRTLISVTRKEDDE